MSEPDQSVTELANDPGWVFAEITRRLKKSKVPDAQLRLTEHIRSVTGKNNILAFYQNGATKERKLEVLGQCLTAVISGDFSKLQGCTPTGQAARNDPFADIKIAEPEPPVKPNGAPAPEPLPETAPVVVPPVSGAKRDKAAAMKALLDQILEPDPAPVAAPSVAQVDPEEVRRLVNEVCASHVKEQANNLRGEHEAIRDVLTKLINDGMQSANEVINVTCDQARKRVTDYLKEIPPREVVQIHAVSGQITEIARQHYKFSLLLAALSQRLNVLLVGPAGSSKTTAAHAASVALGLKFEAMSVGPMTSKADLFGFKDAHGVYHDTGTVRAATTGGVMLWDEIDAANAGVLTAGNMLLANGHIATPEGMRDKHKDFVLIAAANTYGMGANRVYVGRNQLDGATLDRFVMIDWGYDEGLEAHILGLRYESPQFTLDAGGSLTAAQWFDHVLKVRAACEKLGIRHVVSPRASIHGSKLFAAGVGREHVEEMVLWKGMDSASKAKIKAGL
jgi:AAA domain (dynein-related subfamily)